MLGEAVIRPERRIPVEGLILRKLGERCLRG